MPINFERPPNNMVQDVRNAIEGYGMGPLRALAQEPVQNSKDAKCQALVRVEYRLHKRILKDGQECFLLTVTDYGTTGLKGTILSRENRDGRGPVFEEGENWAAFQGQGFTKKEQDDALGSRGQGKAALLYHSSPIGRDGFQLGEHLMLYDTRLASGEYRLGVRYASPEDGVMKPPLLNGAAQAALSNSFDTENGIVVPLELEPLVEPGTRVIVPFLAAPAIEAIESQELHRWLERCWWRAIQVNDVEITVTDETGQSKEIQPPTWWQSEPWLNGDKRTQVHENFDIEGNLKIKRIVLHYDESIEADEIDDRDTQYSGVQLLRGQQWIQTIDARDYNIPSERLAGFRGFAEFEKPLERKLKEAENPQHESFDRRLAVVKNVRAAIGSAVKQFAEKNGWLSETEAGAASKQVQEFATEFLNVFAGGTGATRRKRGGGANDLNPDRQLNWNCELLLDFPTAESTRVNWGESLTNVRVAVEFEPFQSSRQANILLELKREGNTKPTIVAESREILVPEGGEIVSFGDFQVVEGHAGSGKIRLTERGEWTLCASVRHREEEVASASKRIYLEKDPPDHPQQKPQTISVSVKNISRHGESRISHGDEISVQVTVTNRDSSDANLQVNASLEALLLADGKEVALMGVPAGGSPNSKTVIYERLRVYTSHQLGFDEDHIVLDPGRYYLRSDLWAPGKEEPVAHSSQPIYIEVDPGGNRGQMPFTLESIEDSGPHPMWELEERADDDWVLRYPSKYPLYHQLRQPQRRHSRLAGQSSFIAEICANGLLEWALEPLYSGDKSRVDLIKHGLPESSLTDSWKDYSNLVDRLAESFDSERIDDHREYMKRWRKTVAAMLELFEGMG